MLSNNINATFLLVTFYAISRSLAILNAVIKQDFGYRKKLNFAQKQLEKNIEVYNTLDKKNVALIPRLEKIIKNQIYELGKYPKYYRNETIARKGGIKTLRILAGISAILAIVSFYFALEKENKHAIESIQENDPAPLWLLFILFLFFAALFLAGSIISIFLIKGYNKRKANTKKIVFSEAAMAWVSTEYPHKNDRDLDNSSNQERENKASIAKGDKK
jgi:uncharacterized membrane protein